MRIRFTETGLKKHQISPVRKAGVDRHAEHVESFKQIHVTELGT